MCEANYMLLRSAQSALGCVQTQSMRHGRQRARDSDPLGEIINRNFSLVATGVATAKIKAHVAKHDHIKVLILFGEVGGRTRTSNLGPAD